MWLINELPEDAIKRLKEIVELHKLSITELSNNIGYTRVHVSGVLNQTRYSDKVVYKIMNYLQLSPDNITSEKKYQNYKKKVLTSET